MNFRRRRTAQHLIWHFPLLELSLVAVVLGGCLALPPASPVVEILDTPIPTTTPEQMRPITDQAGEPVATPTLDPLRSDGVLTYHNPDGNRWVQGRGYLHECTPLDLPLSGTPVWVLGAPFGKDILWVVTLADGMLEAYQGSDRIYKKVPLAPERLPAGEPISLWTIEGVPGMLNKPSHEGSSLSHPIRLPLSEMTIFINLAGDLVFEGRSGELLQQLPVDALPDARILRDEKNRLLVLSSPTERYAHGVLCDKIEAASITLLETQPQPSIVRKISISPPDVIEGIMPLWYDLNADGEREVIVTLSNADQGAQLRVYDENGELIASSQPIGTGYRWRHQVAAAPMGPSGEMEIISVLTPHLGGVVEFFQLYGDQLIRVATIPGFSSHLIRSHNLDMAAVGDFDGDNQIELLVPDQAMTSLTAIQRTAVGAEIDWSLPLAARLGTNLAFAPDTDGRLVLGIGQEDNSLRLCVP